MEIGWLEKLKGLKVKDITYSIQEGLSVNLTDENYDSDEKKKGIIIIMGLFAYLNFLSEVE